MSAHSHHSSATGDPSGALLHFDDVEVRFTDGQTALRKISGCISRGEFIAITGNSGSGKTTLLRTVAGALDVCAGTFEKCGRVASIHQDLRLVPTLSAYANVLHGALSRESTLSVLKGYNAIEKRKARELIKSLGLERVAHRRVSLLSGGERQRVAIARALMQDPEILLADEPVASLDRSNSLYVLSVLRALADAGRVAVLCVLHDDLLAARFADRLISLSDGEITGDRRNSRQVPVRTVDEISPPEEASRGALESGKVPGWMWAVGLGIAFAFLVWSSVALSLTEGNPIASALRAVSFIAGLFPASVSQIFALPWGTLLGSLLETIQMAFVGTVIATLVSLPLSALAASNLSPRAVSVPVRLLLNVIRTVPSLIWALICVAAIGFGPGAGVTALVAYSVGYLTKFFYEAFENVNRKTPEALAELGANPAQRFLCGVLPLAYPALLSSMFFMFEYNVRAASVLGIVDAGGIGFYLKQYIDFRFFPAVGAGLALLFVVVVALDAVSQRLRAAISKLGD